MNKQSDNRNKCSKQRKHYYIYKVFCTYNTVLKYKYIIYFFKCLHHVKAFNLLFKYSNEREQSFSVDFLTTIAAVIVGKM